MRIGRRVARNVVSAALTVSLIAACGGEKPETMVASARDYLAKNDPRAASIQLKNALQQDPSLSEARFLLGKALFDTGDMAGAEVELRKAFDAQYSPDLVVPLFAQSLLATGQAKKVLEELQKVPLTTPEAKADFAASVAVAYATQGKLEKAKEAIDSALATSSDQPRAAMMKARLLLTERNVTGALAIVERLIAKNDKAFDAWNMKGDILEFQKDPEGALAAYRKAVEAKPDSAMGHVSLINAYMRRNKLDEAGAQLATMKKSVPKSQMTLITEASYLFQKKELERAGEVTQELLRIAPNNPKALLMAGAIQLQLNQLSQAEANLTRVVKAVPESVSARRLLATVYLRSGQSALAETTIEPVLDLAEKDAGLLSLAGDIYMKNGNIDKAEEYFSKAAALDPGNPTRQARVALAHLAEGNESGFAELERIASGDTGTTADMALIASAIRSKDFTKALRAIDALEKKQPDSPLVFTLRGTLYAAKGDVATARKNLENALSLKPGHFPAAVALASLDLNDKKPDQARKRFESVLAADPKNFQAHLALAELKAKEGGKPEDVVAHLRKAVDAQPNIPTTRAALTTYYLSIKDAKSAVSAAQEAVTALPDRPEMLDMLARAQQAAGDTNQALAACNKMASLMPGSPQPFLRMAEINAATNRGEDAIQNLRKAVDIKPDLLAAQKGLVALYVAAKKYSEASAVAQEVKRQRPKEAIGFALEGDVAWSRRQWVDAASAYRAGLKAAPSSELAIKLHMVYVADGKADEAEKFAASWFADHPQDAAFRLAMAENATAQKNYTGAVRHYQRLVQMQPNNAALLNNLAWVLGRMNDPRALEFAEKANKIAPDQPAILDTLGSLLVERREVTRGVGLLTRALELAPDSPTLKLSLARALIKAGKPDDARKYLQELSGLGDKFSAQAEVQTLVKEIGN